MVLTLKLMTCYDLFRNLDQYSARAFFHMKTILVHNYWIKNNAQIKGIWNDFWQHGKITSITLSCVETTNQIILNNLGSYETNRSMYHVLSGFWHA